MLEVRLSEPLPADLAAQIAATTNADILHRWCWFELALRVPDYELFRRHTQE